MASITRRELKNGEVVYELRVYRGRDPETGKPLRSLSMRYHPAGGLTGKRLEEAVKREADNFERCCQTTDPYLKRKARHQHYREILVKGMTFRLYSGQFLLRMAGELAPGSLVNYKRVLEMCAREFGETPLHEIQPSVLRNYLFMLQYGELKPNYKPAWNTVLMHYTVLHRLFTCAVEEGAIAENPMNGVRRPKPRKDELIDPVKAFSPEEAQRLLRCMEGEPLKWRAFVVFLMDSGCRRGEAVALQWRNVSLSSGRVTIEDNAQYTKERGVYVTTPKSGKKRVIYINREAVEVLRALKAEQSRGGDGGKVEPPAFVFPGRGGRMMHPQTATQRFKILGQKYGIEDLHPHRLRHTMATLSIANGADVVSVSQKLGHSRPSVTLNVYSHVSEAGMQRANEALRGAIYGQEAGEKEEKGSQKPEKNE